MKRKRVISLKEVELFIEWFRLHVMEATKRKVLILIGIESAYNTAKHRKQDNLSLRVSDKAFDAAKNFNYDFDDFEDRRVSDES
jgi:hypothetical protein